MKKLALLQSLGPGLLALLLGACATTAPSRFYVLSSPPEAGPGVKGRNCIVLGMGPVEIPAYLDRPQIVVRISPNEIQPSDFEQWGEPLAQGVARVMAEAIAAEVCVKRVEFFPWKSFSGVDYQVSLRIKHFEASPGERVELSAHWSLYGSDPRKPLREGTINLKEPMPARGYQEMVAGQSRLLQAGAKQITEALLQVLR